MELVESAGCGTGPRAKRNGERDTVSGRCLSAVLYLPTILIGIALLAGWT